MKKRQKWLTLALVGLISVFTLAGCGSETTTTSETTTSTSGETESTTADDAYTVGEVTSIGTTSLTLKLYDSSTPISTLADIDSASLSENGESLSLSLNENTVVERYTGGATQTTTADELAVGNIVAVDATDSQRLTIIESDESTASSDNTTYDQDTSTEDSTIISE